MGWEGWKKEDPLNNAAHIRSVVVVVVVEILRTAHDCEFVICENNFMRERLSIRRGSLVLIRFSLSTDVEFNN